MKIIQELSAYIDDEIKDAKKYAERALEVKDQYPDLADIFSRLSDEEMGHMERLHKGATEIITAYRKDKGDPPVDMLAVYEYLHKRQIENAAEVRRLREMYKGM